MSHPLIDSHVENAVGITFSDWAESRQGEVMRPVEDYRHSTEDVLISGDAAVVRADIDWPATYFVDYLSLLHVDDEWKIVSKIWTQPSEAACAGANRPASLSSRQLHAAGNLSEM